MPRKKPKDHTFEELSAVARYLPASGEFFHKSTGAKLRSFTSSDGYTVILLLGTQFLAHRLAWMLMKGSWPEEHIDHVNRRRSDNRWPNLREATLAQNNANSVKSKQRDLPTGVRLNRNKTNPYMAIISVGNRSKYIGSFPTPERAHIAYLREKERVHGEFSPFATAAQEAAFSLEQ